MTVASFDLSKLGSDNFEHLVNALALDVLGFGVSTFGPGADGGRDGYFEGQAPYPSTAENWSGRWYIQSKFHAPHLSSNAQKWLKNQIREEIKEFQRQDSQRIVPDIWIITTNIDISATAESGTFDQAIKMVRGLSPELARRFHIWGGGKIINLLHTSNKVSERYAQFITQRWLGKSAQRG